MELRITVESQGKLKKSRTAIRPVIVLGDANLIQRSILVLRDGDKAQHPIALHRQPTVGVVGGAEGAVLRHDRIQRLRLEDAALKGRKVEQFKTKKPATLQPTAEPLVMCTGAFGL